MRALALNVGGSESLFHRRSGAVELHLDGQLYAATQTLGEARHTAYGLKYLSAVLPSLTAAEVAELEDFAFEASRMLIDQSLVIACAR